MTKYFLGMIACFMLWSLVSCREKGGWIKGEIANLEAPYLLAAHLAEDALEVDTIHVDKKGRFSFRTQVDTLTAFSIYLNDYEASTVVFADRDQKLTVKGDAMYPDLIRINGNEVNDDLTAFKINYEELLKKRGQLLVKIRGDNGMDTTLNTSTNRQEEMGKLNVLNHEITVGAEEYIMENPSKLSSLILISNFFTNSDNPSALERVLGYLEGDVKRTELAARLTSYSEKLNRSAEGATAPYFQLEDEEGNAIRSYDFSGKYLVLSFISSAGVESRETVALLKQAYEELDEDSVQFITVYIDTNNYPVEYVEGDSIPWTVVTEERGWGADIVNNFNVQYVPFNVLISPDRTIQVRNIAAQGIVDEIKKRTEEETIADIG
ncbi:MAG: TlpA disulfide reductase family protein [Bacteroidota bacterium]|jgi:cytochrome oxidase Cu insertion factor (SCO1/SenC/PrrC family)|nr:TlpA disulfide reductase family protein [Bacteroidota bacterium]